MPGVSIVICCHNSCSRLPATLAHLRRQAVPPDLPWEVIVVDNMSTDDTADVARRSWQQNPNTNLRVVQELRLGLSFARHRGFSEAKYDIVSFIDDDNWVCPEWVQIVADVMSRHLDVGACGGLNEATCETSPPSWFERYKESYAIGSQGEEAGDVSGRRGFLWGAGLSVRKSAWEQLVADGFQSLLVDRKGERPTAGGDAEISFALRLMGWKLWYEPGLRLQHVLPARRLEWHYLRSLHRGFGASSVWLDLYSYALKGRPKTLTERLSRMRPYKIVAASIKLLWYRGKVLLSFWQRAEGKRDVLEVEVRIGRLLELLQTKRTYELPFRGGGDISFRRTVLFSESPNR